jgi:hypothetical protein
MLPSIHVKPTERGEKITQPSRINYAKMYTVEYNVKVYDFGMVRQEFVDRLKQSWRYVLDQTESAPSSHALGVAETATESIEDEVGDEDQNEDNGANDGNLAGQLESLNLDCPEPCLPAKATALHPWSATDQLSFRKGDTIILKKFIDENWAQGRNTRTKKWGHFPRGYVQLVNQK